MMDDPAAETAKSHRCMIQPLIRGERISRIYDSIFPRSILYTALTKTAKVVENVSKAFKHAEAVETYRAISPLDEAVVTGFTRR